jgi:two-component system, LuxR family, sensor kinase FixL
MTASACLTLALMNMFIWCRQRGAWANLMFALVAVGAAAFAGLELNMMRAATPEQYATDLRWIHVPAWLVILSLAAFVRLYLKAGRSWLLWTIFGVRTLALLLNFLLGQNLNYWEITRLQPISFLGEHVFIVGEGVSNHWMLLGQTSLLLLLAFVVDATLTAWRQGDRGRALIVGGSVVFFVFAAAGEATLVLWQLVRWPVIASLPALVTIAAMAYELSSDQLRANQLARELQESEERIRLASEAAAVGHWRRDLVRNEIWATEQWRMLLGFARGEPVAYEGYLQKLHPEDRESVRQVQAKALGDEGGYETEYRVLLPGGGVRWISSRGKVEFNSAGKPIVVRGVSVDITKRRLADLEIARQRNEVAHLSRVTTLGEISGSLAHELNQPLGAMLVNLDSVEMHLQNQPPNLNEVRTILADIRKDNLRAGEIIHGIRAFLRRRDLEMRPLAVDQLVAEAVRLVSADAESRKITIGFEVPPHLPDILGDRIHLQQVLINLLINGMDAMSACPLPLRRIRLRASRPNPDAVELAVIDAGAGVPPGDLSRVLDPFHSTKPEGLGLGLAICRSIVEAHGGSVNIENNLDRGATARFTLPVFREEPTA